AQVAEESSMDYHESRPSGPCLRWPFLAAVSVCLCLVSWTPARAGDEKLEAILQGMRDGEHLFRNISFEFETETKLLLPQENWEKSVNYVKHMVKRARLVNQGTMFYIREEDEGESLRKGPFHDRTTIGHERQ